MNLNRERDEYLACEQQKLAATAKSDGLDEQVAATIRSQAVKKGFGHGK